MAHATPFATTINNNLGELSLLHSLPLSNAGGTIALTGGAENLEVSPLVLWWVESEWEPYLRRQAWRLSRLGLQGSLVPYQTNVER